MEQDSTYQSSFHSSSQWNRQYNDIHIHLYIQKFGTFPRFYKRIQKKPVEEKSLVEYFTAILISGPTYVAFLYKITWKHCS